MSVCLQRGGSFIRESSVASRQGSPHPSGVHGEEEEEIKKEPSRERTMVEKVAECKNESITGSGRGMSTDGLTPKNTVVAFNQ